MTLRLSNYVVRTCHFVTMWQKWQYDDTVYLGVTTKH